MIGLEEELSKLEVIVSEVDGVLTMGDIDVDELGNVPFKKFYVKDFEAINILKKTFKVVFLSADNSISYNFMRKKNIPFYYDPKSKKAKLVEIMKRYGVTPEQIMYIGYNYSDIECMRMIPFSVCPDDAVSDVINISVSTLPVLSGSGVFCAIYDMLKPEIQRRLKRG